MIPTQLVPVYAGIDTHADTHHLGLIEATGRALTDIELAAGPGGYQAALELLDGYDIAAIGVECTGSYGAGITRALRSAGYQVVEVNRPNRFDRRTRGKTDQFDAYSAAEAVLSGRAQAAPKGGTGLGEMLRVLRLARTTAVAERTATINQLRALLVTGPEELREPLRGLSRAKLVTAVAGLTPQAHPTSVHAATVVAAQALAVRYQFLHAQDKALTKQINQLLREHAPALLAVYGVGPDTAAALLITAGDNPDRLRSEASFAALCGVTPIQASSGRTVKHRLNRGGDRQANAALYRIAVTRLAGDPETQAYLTRRTGTTDPHQRQSTKAAIRSLKRYIARQLYPTITAITNNPTNTQMDPAT